MLKYITIFVFATLCAAASFLWRHQQLNNEARGITFVIEQRDKSIVPAECAIITSRYEYTTTDLIIRKNATCNSGPSVFTWHLRDEFTL